MKVPFYKNSSIHNFDIDPEFNIQFLMDTYAYCNELLKRDRTLSIAQLLNRLGLESVTPACYLLGWSANEGDTIDLVMETDDDGVIWLDFDSAHVIKEGER